MPVSRRIVGVGVAAVVIAVGMPAGGAARVAGGPTGLLQPIPHAGDTRLGSQLAGVLQTSRTRGASAALAVARTESDGVVGALVRVIVQPREGDGAGVDAAISAVGGVVEAEADGLVQALVPPSSLQQLGGDATVADVSPPDVPVAQSLDEGVAATGADAWQGVGDDGAGVKVAIIDLGFYGYQSLLGTALPSSVQTDDRCGGNLSAAPAQGGTQHGTAVAELVHQMAPDAELYLICVDSEVTLAQAEQDAVADGVQVINHSVSWFNTSRGDGSGGPGSPDATVADARAHGILWVNAAGNYAEDHWSGTFTPDPAQPEFNDFAAGVDTDGVAMEPNEQACVYLKWDDWPVTSEDFDLGLYDSDGNLVAASTNDQSDGPLPPTEALCYTNPSASLEDYYIGIQRYAAVGNPSFDLFYTGSSGLQYATASGSVTEPASSPDALAVGAECWQTGALEPFSSQGVTISHVIKPELTAPDSVSTSTYGAAAAGSVGCGASGFVGTSAAAPQVTGAAADILSQHPSLTVAGLEAQLEATTISASSQSLSDAWGNGPLALGSPNPPATGGVVFVQNGQIVAYPDTAPVLSTTPVPIPVSGLASGDAPVTATISPDGSTIAFTDTDGGVWTVPDTGGPATEIVPSSANAASYGAPGWSPGGSKIAYGSSAGITVVDANGADPTVIGSVGYGPQWSPNGNELAVWSDATGEGFPGVIPAGSESVQPVSGESPPASAWSPDGTSVLGAGGSGLFELNVTTQVETHLIYSVNTMAFAEWIDDGGDVLLDQENGPAPGLWRYSLGGGLATGVFGANAPYPSWAPRDVAGPESDFPPVTSGTASVGETLEASVGTWSPAQGATFSFSWSRCTNDNTSCVPISGAEDSVYQASSADVGFSLMATVTATYEGVSRRASSELFGPVEVASPYATALPTVSGTSTLTLASPGSWTGSPTFAEQWLRCDVNGANCAPIAGQTGTAYAPGTADQGSTIRVAVTGTNPGGASVATSEAVAVGAGLPGAPTNASAVAGNGQVTVSFTAPSANGGSPISSYTVSSSPGGVQATGSASPITVSGLTNGISYTFTVTATNGVGTGAASAATDAVTPTVNTGGGAGGGSSHGGGGSDSISVAIGPGVQSVTSGATASWTVTVTNTGGNYVFETAVSDPTVPSCNQTGGQTPALSLMAPGVTVSYTCSQQVSSTLTNTVNASAVGPAGDTTTASASATVTVTAAATPPPLAAPRPKTPSTPLPTPPLFATLSVVKLQPVLLNVKTPLLNVEVKLSKSSTLVLLLLDSRGHKLASWTEKETGGLHKLKLLLPAKARHKGHEVLDVTETGDKQPTKLPVSLKI